MFYENGDCKEFVWINLTEDEMKKIEVNPKYYEKISYQQLCENKFLGKIKIELYKKDKYGGEFI